jgi:hypothetical protein
MEVIGVFIWLVISIIIGVISKDRGHTFITGFFISLLLSPLLALIIIYVMKNKKQLQDDKIVFTNTYKCKWCEFGTNQYSDFCPNCAKNINGKTMKQHYDETGIKYQNNATIKYVAGALFKCKWCDFQSQHHSEYCTNCGKNIAGKTQKELLDL